MKAIIYTEYGSPEVLRFQEVEKPTPKENEVLVKIHAASSNAADVDLMRGRYQPPFSRKPRFEILGSDIAGRIEAVGRSITQFQIGDEILADLTKPGFGAFAEYVCVPEKELRLKPVSMTFEQAATIPQSAVVAIQGIKKKKKKN